MAFRDEHLKLIGKLMAENISFEVDSYGEIPMGKITINDTCDITVWYYSNKEMAKEGVNGYFEIAHTSAKGCSRLIRKTADDVITIIFRFL